LVSGIYQLNYSGQFLQITISVAILLMATNKFVYLFVIPFPDLFMYLIQNSGFQVLLNRISALFYLLP